MRTELRLVGILLLMTAVRGAEPERLRGLWQGPAPVPPANGVRDDLPRTAVPGDPPASGQRYWKTPFAGLPFSVDEQGNSYVTVIRKPSGEVEFWANEWGPDSAENRTVFVRRGPSLETLGERQAVFDGTIIDDVPPLDGGEGLAPARGFTRTSMFFAPAIGYVLLCCVCPDYLPGRAPLMPALVTSPTGRKGDWTYRGKLTGEPAAEAARILAERKRPVWSDGGTLVRLDDGRWRIYLNGYGQVLAAVEADQLAGPWRFVRNADGAIRELLPDFPSRGIFSHVLRTPAGGWHLWLTDKWPPQSIWHYHSTDGLNWERFGRQPEITRDAVGGRSIKCLRVHHDAAKGDLVGLLAVWGPRPNRDPGWLSYVSRMPANLQP